MLPPDLIAPDYDGLCISRVAGWIRHLFGLPEGEPAPDGVFPAGAFDRVALVIVDALGWEQVQAHRGRVPAMERVLEAGVLGRLTSVLPSTTTAALTSLLSGLTPQEHGMLGYTCYLRELGCIAELIHFRTAWATGPAHLLPAGGDPRTLFPIRTLYEQLNDAGIQTRALMPKELVGSVLSRVQLAGATELPFYTAADLCCRLYDTVVRARRPLFVTAYWHGIDSIAHAYGPHSREEAAELGSFFSLFESEFLSRLTPAMRRRTLVLLTSDHGQILAPAEQAYRLDDHPELAGELLMPPAGDRRVAYLYPRAGGLERVRQVLALEAERFCVLSSENALAAGLFGRGVPAAETPVRLGDLVCLARGGATLVPPQRGTPKVMRGRHGGATAGEMYVPLFVMG